MASLLSLLHRYGKRAWSMRGLLFAWVPLTLPGLATVVLLCWLRQAYGIERQDGLLFSLTSVGLALIAFLALLVVLTALRLRFRRKISSSEMLSLDGRTTETGFSIGWSHLVPLIKIDVAWEKPASVEVELISRWGRLIERVRAHSRGLEKQVARRIRVSDVFGLTSIVFRQRQSQQVRIAPDAGKVQSHRLLVQMMPGDEIGHPEGQPVGDLLDTRGYGPGDPLKMVLWKQYARTGQLIVRSPERAISPSPRTLVYFVAGPADEPSAGVARALLENGSLGTEFLFGADGDETLACTAATAIDQVIRSVGSRARGGEGLADFLARGEARGICACILFLPARPGRWLDRVGNEMAQHRGPFRVIIGIDGTRKSPGGRLSRLLFQGESSDWPSAEELRRIRDRFVAIGASVQIIHRRTGDTVEA